MFSLTDECVLLQFLNGGVSRIAKDSGIECRYVFSPVVKYTDRSTVVPGGYANLQPQVLYFNRTI